MRTVTVSATQMACGANRDDNLNAAESLVRDAARDARNRVHQHKRRQPDLHLGDLYAHDRRLLHVDRKLRR